MYKIHKGVSKPIMFKGFKGNYIYMAGGCLGLAIVVMIFLSSSLGFIVSSVISIVIGGGGISLILKKQSKGMGGGKKHTGIYIVKNRLTKL